MKLRFGLVLSSALTLALGGCAASSGGSSAPATAPEVTGGAVLAQGERPREDENTRAAQDHLEQAEASATPDEAAAHYQAALQSAQAAIQGDTLNPLAYRLAAQANLGLGDYEAAGAMFDEAERLRPIYTIETERTRELAWIDRYQAAAPLVNAGDYEAAVVYFEQANAIYQGRPEVMITLGQVYAQLGDFEKSIENLRAAQDIINSDRINEMDEETAASWREQGEEIPVMIAQSLVNAGRYDEAVVALRELVAQDPTNLSFRRTLGSTYVRMEQPDSAKAVFDEMMTMGGMTSAEYYAVGVGYYQMEDFISAARAFEAAAEVSVNDREALEMLARALQIEYPAGGDAPTPPPGVLEKLRGAAERWVELDPNNQNAYLILAQTVNRLGDEDRARDLVGAIEALPVTVEGIQMQRASTGGGIVVGTIRNKTVPAGTTATVEVTFYAPDGTVMGTQTARVQLGEAETSQDFRVDFDTTEYVGGYSYEVIL
ncbi:MAG TPA: tetratricopeptide repeat protein [Longimicrobiales bacterium]|nr:tetratricopeptide repeat protein [Longimicrobiales bacterium]